MSLSEHYIKAIFTKLTLVYGRDFLSKYEGQDMANVEADWAHELAGFQEMPSAIKYALQNLDPNKAPNVLQFRDICRRAPRDTPLMLKEHFKRTPESDRIAEKVRAELMARLSKLPQKEGGK